mmetsp:Transcript_21608/g.63426  ORF Transcript_21608/g.63426 Transcript_21608/m.63426 type:complete len:291 (+) Transcript_21608:1282-2154(+)
MAGPAVLSSVRRIGGHPRHQPAHVDGSQIEGGRSSVLLPLPPIVGVRRHVRDVQGILRSRKVHAGVGLRPVLSHRGGERQLDRQVRRADHRRDHGRIGTIVPHRNCERSTVAQHQQAGTGREGEIGEVRRGQGSPKCLRGHSGTQQVPPVPDHPHPPLHHGGRLDVPEIPGIDGGGRPRGEARGRGRREPRAGQPGQAPQGDSGSHQGRGRGVRAEKSAGDQGGGGHCVRGGIHAQQAVRAAAEGRRSGAVRGYDPHLGELLSHDWFRFGRSVGRSASFFSPFFADEKDG